MSKDEWLTPPWLLEHLGEFDLDPCAPIDRPWATANDHYTRPKGAIGQDGLMKPWTGRIWLNPPYGKNTGVWLRRLADHGNGIALVFASTETKFFFETVWDRSDALLFIKGYIFIMLMVLAQNPTLELRQC